MHEIYLRRCCDLANFATAQVSPNPRVGAVLVHQGRIIGEGYHRQAGQAHAEVNCLASVAEADRPLISVATLYVSLEPCCFHGRTPACTGLILKNKIAKVVIGQRDQTAEVNGQGIQILRDAGVEVVELPAFQPAAALVAPRQLFIARNRPYTLLKYAQSADGFLAPLEKKDYWITNKISRRLVHFWRSRTSAILVGAGTVLADDPQLNTRLYPGPQPIPFIIDPRGRIRHEGYRIFARKNGHGPVLLQPTGTPDLVNGQQIFCDFPTFPAFDYRSSKAEFELTPDDQSKTDAFIEASRQLVKKIRQELVKLDCNHVTVEGGAWLLSVFIAANAWEEARVFRSSTVHFGRGISAPALRSTAERKISMGTDELFVSLATSLEQM